MTLATGWSTTQFYRSGTAAATAVPVSLCCWVWAESGNSGVAQDLLGLYNSAGATNRNLFKIGLSSAADTVIAGTASGTAVASGATTGNMGTYPKRKWFLASGSFSSITSRIAYMNGQGAGSNATSLTPSGINRTSIGVEDGSAAARPLRTGSTIAFPAIWNVALSAAEWMAIAAGLSPLQIRPQALRFFSPNILSGSLLVDGSAQRNNLTMQSTLRMTPEPRSLTDLLERPPAFDALPRLPTEVWQRPHNPNLMPHLRR